MAQIALKVVQHKKLFVTTEGQMFTVESDANEAVRVKNMILDDANDFAGVVTLTEDMFTPAKNKEYVKSPEKFSELFKDARVPVAKKKEGFQRKVEKVVEDDKKAVADINAAFGIEKPKVSKEVKGVEDAPKD